MPVQKNSLLKKEKQIIRVLEVQKENHKAFIIDCLKRTMPVWVNEESLSDYFVITDLEMQTDTNMVLPEVDSLTSENKKFRICDP